MNPKRITESILALFFATVATAQTESVREGQDRVERLDIRAIQSESTPVSLSGFVKARNKYSIDVDNGSAVFPVRFATDAEIKLKVTSPRIDFDSKQLIIDVVGAQKRYRGYPIPVPLFVRIDFLHESQWDRVRAQSVKRLSGYELLARQPEKEASSRLQWIGELKPGESNRQLKLQLRKSDSVAMDILLAKRGTLGGFKISDLKAGITAVQVTGQLGKDGIVIARKVVFWPSVESPHAVDANSRPDDRE